MMGYAAALHLCIYWMIFSGIIAVALPPPIPPTAEILNLTALPDLPDKDFGYVASYRGSRLDKRACIMAGVNAMRDLALLAKNDFIDLRHNVWTHPLYPTAKLEVVPDPAVRMISARYAGWIINAAIKDMMIRETYETSAFFGWYRHVGIGRVLVSRNGAPRLQLPSVPPPPNSSAAAPGKVTSFNITGTQLAADDQLHADINYVGKDMDMRDSMAMIIYTLMSLGGRHDTPLGSYHVTLDAVTVQVRSIWNRIETPGKATYHLTSGYLIPFLLPFSYLFEGALSVFSVFSIGCFYSLDLPTGTIMRYLTLPLRVGI